MSVRSFWFCTTALEAIEGHVLKGYNIIVTGSNSGLGIETVRAFAKAGANCFMTARNIEKAQSVADDIISTTGNKNIHLDKLELDSLDSVNSYVEKFLEKDEPLHILVNNAGVAGCPHSFTKDGIEMQFGTNHIGHFALTTGLIPALKKGVVQSGRNSRVVNVGSLMHVNCDFDFEDYNFEKRKYEPYVSYGQSKTANSLFSLGLTERFAKDGIFSNSLHPGVIITNIQRHAPERVPGNLLILIPWINLFVLIKCYIGLIENYKLKTVEQGAATTVWAATAQELDGKGGLYLEDCKISDEVNDIEKIKQEKFGFMSFIMDKTSSDKLWDLSEKLIRKN